MSMHTKIVIVAIGALVIPALAFFHAVRTQQESEVCIDGFVHQRSANGKFLLKTNKECKIYDNR